MGSTTTPITTLAQAANIAALLKKTAPVASSEIVHGLSKRLEDIQLNPEGYVVFKNHRGQIVTASIGTLFDSREELAKAIKKDYVGHSGRGFFIQRTDGSKFVCHDIWSIETIPADSAHLFEDLVNTFVFREASREEDRAWFAERGGF